MQILGVILVYGVFILLFIALILYIGLTTYRFVQESRLQRKMRRGITSSDMVSLVSASPDAMLIVNQAGMIVQANHQAATLFDYLDLSGQQVERLLPEHLRLIHREHRARYHTTPRVRPMGEGLNLQGVRSDSSTFGILVSLSPITIESEQHVIAIVRARK